MAIVRIESPIPLSEGIYLQKETWASIEQGMPIVDTTYSLIDEDTELAIMEIDEFTELHQQVGKCSQTEVGFMISSGNDETPKQNNFYAAIYGPELKNVHPDLSTALRFGICQFKAFTQNLAAKLILQPQEHSVNNVPENPTMLI